MLEHMDGSIGYHLLLDIILKFYAVLSTQLSDFEVKVTDLEIFV